MAEGGENPTMKDGSDADFEYTCTPCGEDEIREEAVKFCQECREHLCTTCARCHSRQRATRSHKLVNSDKAKNGSLVVMTTKCRYHPDRDIEMYCGTHDMVYCLKCIATEHSGVIGIEETKASSIQQIEVQRLQNNTINIQKRLAYADGKTKTNIDCLEEQRGDILTKIAENEKHLIEHIQKLKHEATDTLNKDYTLVKDELNSNINQITSMKKEIERATSQLKSFGSLDVGQQFVQMKLIQKTVNDAVHLVENSELNGSKVLCFTENTDLQTSVTTATSLGQVITLTENKQIVPRLYELKTKKKVNVKLQNERDTCNICDVCQLQDGTIILADFFNKKIKRIHVNYTIKDHCDLGECPMGICCTGQNEVAVKMYNNKVQFISVGNSMSRLSKISVTVGDYWVITYCNGELWVSSLNDVNVYSTSGALLKTIGIDANGVDLFKSFTKHMTVSGETVIVTDTSGGAVCLGRDGTVRRELRDGRLVNTEGVCASSDGTVFLSGYSSNNILMFDKNGKCLGALVAKDTGLVNPVSLHYDNKTHRIIVTCASSDNIIILDISD